MTKQHFSFKEVFGFGWAKTKQHAWFVALTFIIAAVITSAVNFVPVVNTIVGMMVSLSIMWISLLIVRNHSFSFADLYTPLLSPARTLKYIALCILFMIAFGVGLVLLVLPGIYILTKFYFFGFTVIENENAKLADLIKMSYRVTDHHFWPVLGFVVLAILLNVVGALLFMVGLIVTVPVTVFATAHMYDRLKSHTV